jgi:hypothetical protein
MAETIQLDSSERTMLAEVARLIANGDTNTYVDLVPLTSMFYSGSKAPLEFLTTQVEELSSGQLTLRQAEQALFGVPDLYPGLCMVLQTTGQAKDGIVTEITPGMTPVAVGPYSSGIKLPAQLAPDELVQARRARREQALLEWAIREDVDNFTTLLRTKLLQLAEEAGKLDVVTTALGDPRDITLWDLGMACRKLDMYLQDPCSRGGVLTTQKLDVDVVS